MGAGNAKPGAAHEADHPFVVAGLEFVGKSWICDGCRRRSKVSVELRGRFGRFRCAKGCDFDLCHDCVPPEYRAAELQAATDRVAAAELSDSSDDRAVLRETSETSSVTSGSVDVGEFSGKAAPSRTLESITPGTLAEAKRISPGTLVRVSGLRSAVHFNGLKGECIEWDKARGRWLVDLENGTRKALLPANLFPEAKDALVPGPAPPSWATLQSSTSSLSDAAWGHRATPDVVTPWGSRMDAPPSRGSSFDRPPRRTPPSPTSHARHGLRRMGAVDVYDASHEVFRSPLSSQNTPSRHGASEVPPPPPRPKMALGTDRGAPPERRRSPRPSNEDSDLPGALRHRSPRTSAPSLSRPFAAEPDRDAHFPAGGFTGPHRKHSPFGAANRDEDVPPARRRSPVPARTFGDPGAGVAETLAFAPSWARVTTPPPTELDRTASAQLARELNVERQDARAILAASGNPQALMSGIIHQGPAPNPLARTASEQVAEEFQVTRNDARSLLADGIVPPPAP
mmetsp:Transcript_2508/g.6263  ORF Transcript_2508/g.6263 Transcript_2508/m.6263 type:complete len:513 (-) Transcript_2508:72-1610(-)